MNDQTKAGPEGESQEGAKQESRKEQSGGHADALRAKLRRLRRETGVRKAAETDRRTSARESMPPWLRAHLAHRGERANPNSVVSGIPTRRAKGVGLPADLRIERNQRGVFRVREMRSKLAARHGTWCLGEVLNASPKDLACLAKDETLLQLQPGRAAYLDIETTGLSGGAGTTAFLVALGWFEKVRSEEEFVLWQGFLEGPEQEPALLQAVAERVAFSGGMVSFFGKSFDRHRLEDKMRIHGVAPPFETIPHLDLYHPLKRLYREGLENGKLQTMEQALCGVTRSDDLPGSFAPEAWFDFLAQRGHYLEDVFRHNADDVLSLVVLTAHLGCTLSEVRADGSALSGSECTRAKGVTRVLDSLRQRELAGVWLDRFLERTAAWEDPAFEKVCARVRRAQGKAARNRLNKAD